MALITSPTNPLVKRIRKLRQKKQRTAEGVFFVEGIRVVLSAIESRAPLETIVYAPELLTSEVALARVHEQEQAGVACVAVSAAVYAAISERENPTGLGAILRQHTHALADWSVPPNGLFVALQDVSDPGNIGTIIRTMDAVGADGLLLVGQTAEVGHPTAVKASMGTAFSLPIAQPTAEEMWAWAGQNGLHIIATSARAAHVHWVAPLPRPALLLMGNEQRGLSADWLAMAEVTVKLPMLGRASSLNLAVATGVLLYEFLRREEASQLVS